MALSASAEDVALSPSSSGRVEVLLIDDEPDFVELMAAELSESDELFAVETATSPEEGLGTIQDQPPDCIVSDYDMPGMDGIELLEAVREKHPERPYILYTGEGSEAIASEAISAGATDYLTKGAGPEHYTHLSTVIRTAVEEWRETKRAEKKQELIRLTELASDAGGFELDVVEETMLVTEGALRILDPSEDAELTQKRLVELFDADDQEEIQQTIGRVLTTGDTVAKTFTYHRSDGEERVLKITFISTPTEDSATSVRGVIKDITDQREKQRQINVFDRVLRHNLRNNLNVIRGTAETIESHTTGEITEYGAQIRSKSDRLLETAAKQREIMDVLRKEPEHESIAVESVLQQVATVMRRKHPDAELTVDCPTGVSLKASSRVSQALKELVENGIVHNDHHPVEVHLAAEQHEDALRVTVADNGPAIPEMERGVLVKPQERTPLYHGSGLGLWLVKLIISRSNGEITFDEGSMNGNTITIEFPR